MCDLPHLFLSSALINWLVFFQRSGADFAVYVNTAQEADGCDSGARPDEAVTWGKIKKDAEPVKVPFTRPLVSEYSE